MYKKILVPLDGSESSEAILPHVSQLAASLGAQIVLLEMVPDQVYQNTTMRLPVAMGVPVPPTPDVDLRAQAEGYLQRVAYDYFPDQVVEQHVIIGPTGEGIIDFATHFDIDLVAMTTHGRSGLTRMVMGSVADEVVRVSHLPVLLLRPQSK